MSSVRTSSLNIWTLREKKWMFPSRRVQTCKRLFLRLFVSLLLSLLLLLIFDHIPPASLPCYKYLESEREWVSSGVEWKRWVRWRLNWGGRGKKWRESCKLWGVSLNETRCVTALMCMCATVWIYALLFSRQIGQIWNFGIWATDQEFSSWGVRRGCLGGGGRMHRGPRGGSEWAVPLFLFSFSWTRSHSSCLSPHSLTLTLKRQNKAVEEDEGPERSNREQKRPEEKRSVEEEPETQSKSGLQGHKQKKVFENKKKLKSPVSMPAIF